MKRTIKLLAIAMVLVLSVSLFASCGGGTDIDLDKVNFNKTDLSITDTDFDKMEELLSEMDTAKYDRNVIQITGENATRSSNCSIMIKNGEGVGRGISWEVIDGKFPDSYPADGAKVTITGVLVKDSNGARVLKVPADKVETK